jgi:hypothetical protein
MIILNCHFFLKNSQKAHNGSRVTTYAYLEANNIISIIQNNYYVINGMYAKLIIVIIIMYPMQIHACSLPVCFISYLILRDADALVHSYFLYL